MSLLTPMAVKIAETTPWVHYTYEVEATDAVAKWTVSGLWTIEIKVLLGLPVPPCLPPSETCFQIDYLQTMDPLKIKVLLGLSTSTSSLSTSFWDLGSVWTRGYSLTPVILQAWTWELKMTDTVKILTNMTIDLSGYRYISISIDIDMDIDRDRER